MNAQAEAVAGESDEASSAKDKIYSQISDLVKERTGKRIGKTGGRDVFDLVVGAVFSTAAAEGTIRFNGGFGSFHMKEYQEGQRRLPSGKTTKFGKRHKIRYEEGVVVKALVANGGNLEAALKVRGSRAKPATAAKTATKGTKPASAEDVDLD